MQHLTMTNRIRKKAKDEQFVRKFETVCASLNKSRKDSNGFYWNYYVPCFIDMNDNQLVETSAYIAFASPDNPDVSI